MWIEQQLKQSSEKMNEVDRESLTASNNCMCLGTPPRLAVSKNHFWHSDECVISNAV